MFTGIIEEVGKISRIYTSGNLKQINIACKKMQPDLIQGASISCSGICLTVTAFDNDGITVAAMPETVKKTTVPHWQTGSLINLEKAMIIGSRIEGHIVQGHIDVVTTVKMIEKINNTATIVLSLPREGYHLVVEQGSIAINGVSLTISSLREDSFSVSLVDFTLQNTNLNSLKNGDKVNLEFDIIGKYLYRFTKTSDRRLTKEKIMEFDMLSGGREG